MRETTMVVICVVGVAIAIASTIIGVHYINRDKVHVPSKEEAFIIACAKRGGNAKIEDGKDYAGDKNVDIKDYKCEVPAR